MPNPLTGVNNLVTTALTGFADLTALVPVENIQVWDRDVDIRGNVEGAADMGARIWIVPGLPGIVFDESSGSVRHERNYDIGFGSGKIKIESLCDIERELQRALARLNGLKQPDGVTPIVDPEPFKIQSALPRGLDLDREPLDDPEEWTALYSLKIVAFEPRSALLA